MLPGVTGLRGPLSCLTQARTGILFGALGAARDCLETAIDYAGTRTVFGITPGRLPADPGQTRRHDDRLDRRLPDGAAHRPHRRPRARRPP